MKLTLTLLTALLLALPAFFVRQQQVGQKTAREECR